MKENGLIKHVTDGSIAQEIGIEAGDLLLQINGEPVEDVFQYRFACANEELLVSIKKSDGQVWDIDIEKDEDEDLGLEFVNPLLTEEKHCSNNCIFCFIDQLPKGMRQTLYFKDDDSRLSFLTGNYVTLTNMKDEDLDKIIYYRLSPINVSVHTTNPNLREKMLGNRFAGKVLDQISKLTTAGLTVNAQIVLCRGWNDGNELENSLKDLCGLFPGIGSISVVPVGLTKFRSNLEQLQPFDESSADEVLNTIEKYQAENLKNHGSRIVYAADEFYLKANREVPEFEAYEDFPQIENGVGLISLFRQETIDACQLLLEEKLPNVDRKVLIATGKAADVLIKDLSCKVESLFSNLTIDVIGVENQFFGENVTVCGLLTGQDISQAVKNQLKSNSYDLLLLSSSMLRAGETVFLDDMELDELSNDIGLPIEVCSNSGIEFIQKLSGIYFEMETE